MGETEGDLRWRARELVCEAAEARTNEDALRLLHAALDLDFECIDALLMKTRLECRSARHYLQQLRGIVDLAERQLGAAFFDENRGHFWLVTESRPYLRARCWLADALVDAEQCDEAIPHYEAMLDLNPMDNLGARYHLMGCYLLLRQIGGARWLFESSPDEVSAVFSWAKVLERYLADDLPGSRRALAVASEVNAHVQSYLTGRKRIPRRVPDCYSPGDPSEAAYCACLLKPAWRRHKAALAWLKSYQDGLKEVR